MSKSFFATNPTFRHVHLGSLRIAPYAKNVPLDLHQYSALKASHSHVLEFLVEDSEAQDSDVVVSLVSDMDLSASVKKSLIAGGVETIEQLTAMTSKDVIALKGIADAGLSEIVDVLSAMELTLEEAE